MGHILNCYSGEGIFIVLFNSVSNNNLVLENGVSMFDSN